MQYLRSRFSVIMALLVLVTLIVGGQFAPAPDALAQGGDQCSDLTVEAFATAEEICSELEAGSACFGNPGVTASGEETLAASGDIADLSALQTLATTASTDSGDWGVAVMSLPAGLPEESDTAVRAVLFGNAEVARPAEAAASERPTLKVWNGGGSDVNLRNGAGIMYELVATLAPSQETIADGRNEQADWVRIQIDGGVAWVFTPLIDWEGDLNTLEVLLPNDVTPAMAVSGAPFESFSLTTSTDNAMCGAADSGLLLQYSGEQTASLIINQVGLEFSAAELLVRAAPNDTLDVTVISGTVTVTARGIPEEASAGATLFVNLGGDDGLTPTATPIIGGDYAFSDVAYAPLSMLPDEMACVVGVPAGGEEVTLRVGPGEERGVLAGMKPDSSYTVIGWAAAPDGASWWELDTGSQSAWVAQSNVRAIGTCDAVAQVEPPPVVVAPGGAAPDGGAAPAAGPDLAPTANTVWQMRPGQDVMSGECTGAPAINFCDHLAAIAPAGGGINWKGMEASPYLLAQTQPNVYAYSGPNVLGTGNVNMTLTFTSESTLSMTMTLVLNSEPDCRHTYYYTGSRNW